MQKEKEIMQHVMDTKGQGGHYPTVWGYGQFLLLDNLDPTVHHYGDDVPYKHEKRIHSVGCVGLIVGRCWDCVQSLLCIASTVAPFKKKCQQPERGGLVWVADGPNSHS